MPIFDQGYQHWRGPLSGHGWRWLAIARHGVRVQMKNRILRFVLLVAWLPALVLVAALAGWGLVEQQSEGVLGLARSMLPADVLQDAAAYRRPIWALAFSFFFRTEIFFIFLLVIVAGPGLISRDLRFNALPLYFSRPLTRLDYFLGKLGVIGALVVAVAVGPAVFAYVVGVSFCLDLSVVKDTYAVLVGGVVYGLVVTLSLGTLMLALSSLSRRSLYVGIAFAGFWIISGSVGSLMTAIHRQSINAALREQQARQQGQGQAWPDGQAGMTQAEMLRSDWRPLLSYGANLERLADALLDTDSAWVTFGRAIERSRAAFGGVRGVPGGLGRRPGPAGEPGNERHLAEQMVAQYPWQWSAGVLAALMGLSTCILTQRVKTLDQLK
jgi:ABC-2 type transport system permease protein